VALANRGPDVARRADVEDALGLARQLERLEPDVEREGRKLDAELLSDLVP
jgi:hypothetical protein